MWGHCFTVHYADSAVLCSVQAGVSLCRLTSSQLRCRGCTAADPRNHWRAETSECAALTRVTELPRIAAPVRGNNMGATKIVLYTKRFQKYLSAVALKV